jgi:hypothetical protein
MTEQTTGFFLYGVVPADVEPTAQAKGIGDPPAPVRTVVHQDIAALVSEVSLDRPLGEAKDLLTFQRLLDGTATASPVLPVRFGAVLADRDAVTELLAANHDAFLDALHELEGRVEYAVRGRYHDETVLEEVIADNDEVKSLREQIQGKPEDATMDLRIRLGEIVSTAVEAKRNADSQRLAEALEPFADDIVTLAPTHEYDAANVAALVRSEARDEFESAVHELADEWSDRAGVRLLGPLAPYDFATLRQPGG